MKINREDTKRALTFLRDVEVYMPVGESSKQEYIFVRDFMQKLYNGAPEKPKRSFKVKFPAKKGTKKK